MKNEDWESIYGVYQAPSLHNVKVNTRRSDLGTGNIYVFSCEFNSCETSNSNGGAICVSSATSDTKMLVEKCIFQSCKNLASSYRGGAIWYGNEGNCVISKTCGFSCYAAYNEGFSYTQCSNNINNINYILESSICNCLSKGYNNLQAYRASALYMNINCSNNECIYNSACVFGPTFVSNTVTGIISFSSFINNTATSCRVILTYESGSKRISSCNIIKNEQKDINTDGVIRSNGYLEVEDSYILENIAKFTFSQSSSSYTITVTNCTLDKDISSKKGSYVTITNTVKDTFIIKLRHLNTGNCEGNGLSYITSNRYYLIQQKKYIRLAIILSLIICLF